MDPSSPSLTFFARRALHPFVETKTCKRCNKDIPLDQFTTRNKTKRGRPYLWKNPRCMECSKKHSSEKARDPDRKRRNNELQRSEKYKAKRRKNRKREEVIQRETEYRQSEAGKASLKRRKQTYYGSDTWRAQQDRQNESRRRRYKEDELVRVNIQLTNVVGRMAHGLRRTSGTLYSFTEFEDADDLMSHLQSLFKDGMTVDNYGEVWHIEHRVAKCWYSNTEEDIRRCWSKKNIAPEFGHENLTKSIKSIDKYCNQAGPENWPVEWEGVLPCMDVRRDMEHAMWHKN